MRRPTPQIRSTLKVCKHSIRALTPRKESNAQEGGSAHMDGSKDQPNMTAGLDIGDKYSYLCLIDTQSGEVMEEGRLRTTPEALQHVAMTLNRERQWTHESVLGSQDGRDSPRLTAGRLIEQGSEANVTAIRCRRRIRGERAMNRLSEK